MIIITKELFKKKPEMKYDYIASIEKLEEMKTFFSIIEDKNIEIEIYDLGALKKNIEGPEPVSDHINKTGVNPIIGEKNVEFKDISRLYYNHKGIITTCCGKELNLKYKNSSHYLCVFSILIFYLGFKNIKGFITN
tara:strand:+ start:254 stop:661 length:408 start_codon:yes stop_codon:yes gene_type:complete